MTAKPKNHKTFDDERYLSLAFAERTNSDDPKFHLVSQSGVGAIVVMKGEIVARSANVLPPKLKEHYAQTGLGIQEADRYHFIEHAERAAIFMALDAGLSLKGASMYCTRFPCSDCARAIVWFGISRLVVASGLAGELRWLEAQRAARKILAQSGVTLRVLSRPT